MEDIGYRKRVGKKEKTIKNKVGGTHTRPTRKKNPLKGEREDYEVPPARGKIRKKEFTNRVGSVRSDPDADGRGKICREGRGETVGQRWHRF